MSTFLTPARSLQRFFIYKRPQAQISICSLQRRSLETSSPGARAERPVRLMDRKSHEKIINHSSFVKDISKIPFGYAFVPSANTAIAHICRRMASEESREIFACVSTQRQKHPTESQPSSTKVGPQPAFGLYVPSDIADAATIEFDEQIRAVQAKQIFYIKIFFPCMPSRHIRSMLAKEYKYQHRSDWDLRRLMKRVKWTVTQKIELYLRGYIRKEEGKLTDEEVASVMRSWKDSSKMPDIEII